MKINHLTERIRHTKSFGQQGEGMEFPVDVLVSGRHEDLESSAQTYMNKLLYSKLDYTQYVTLSSARKIQITPANVGFVPLYGANLRHKVLALFAPEDQFTAVALFLADEWYNVEDILRTSDPAREGLIKVRSVGERIVLYVLNRIIYRTVEMGSSEVPFLCHGEDDHAKILWKNGEAVGFYSVKSKGSLCNSFVSQCYLLPVMDSIFVRKNHRGNGHGLQMLEDFVDSFKEDELGLKYPLTQAMQKVCSQYLSRYPADVDLLWEVEGVGGPYQKVKVATKLASVTLKYSNSSWPAEDNTNGEFVLNEVEMTEESSLDITEDVVTVKKHLKAAEETLDLPVSTRSQSSQHRQKKRLREEDGDENRPEKINRLTKEEVEVEPDAVVPDNKEPDVETEGEQEEEKNSIQFDEAESTEAPDTEPEHENPINGELSDSQAEKEAGSTDTAEDVQSGEECSLQPVIKNGTAEEMELEGECESQETLVEKENVVNNPDESEEPATESVQTDQVPVFERKQEAFEEEEEQKEEVEGKLILEVEEEQEESLTHSAEDTKDVDHPPETSEMTSEVPALLADNREAENVHSDQDGEAVGEPSHPQPDASVEKASGAPIEARLGEEAIMETEEPIVNQDRPTSDMLIVDQESQPVTENSTKDDTVVPEKMNEDNTTTTEDEKEEVKSSNESPSDVRVLRGGRSKPVPPTPKRTSGKLGKAVVKEVEEELEEEEKEEEEKLTSTEEEKGSTEEDEAAEHNSEEEEEPPVVDRRVLRRKTNVIQSTPRPKVKRHSKN
nr:soluble lamin-associated protein of 75 kDa isoform X1 [Misgurnus anguillicaudatus]